MADGASNEPDVFLSYAREEEARARELATALDQRGFSVFWDRKVPPGQTWHSYIGEALANARCVVVAWSSHSIASQWVIEEANDGKDRNVLVPILFEKVQPPFGFRAVQAADLIEWRLGCSSPAFDNLLGAVQRIVGGQVSSGAGAEAELVTAPQPAPQKPELETKPSAKPAPRAWRETRSELVRSPNGQARASSRWTVAAAGVGVLAILGGAVLWSRPQPEPTTPSLIPEAEPLTSEVELSEPAAQTEPSVGPATTSPAPSESDDEMRDCPGCPEMVLVPAGEFTMGSPPSEPGRDNDEGPQRKVTIAEPFWVGKYEVTREEFAAFVNANEYDASGGCRVYAGDEWSQDSGKSWRDPGYEQSDRHPVTCVSWEDAQAYVRWLSGETGKDYRLLSEAEREYAARARSGTPRFWGNDADKACAYANVHDATSKRVNEFSWTKHDCDDGFAQTSPAGNFDPNDFRLKDMLGNVWEWVEDCWNDSYDGAPTDGSPWLQGDCSLRPLRGGSWSRVPRIVRSAARVRDHSDDRHYDFRFRVARTAD